MKTLLFSLLAIFLILSLANCNDAKEENYPIEPQLTFQNISFVKGTADSNDAAADTVIITFGITDGDSDIGLDFQSPEYGYFPFNEGYYIKKTTGEMIPWEGTPLDRTDASQMIKYGDRYNAPFDSLPAFSSRYYINSSSNILSEDTVRDHYLYYRINRDWRNVMINNEVHKTDGTTTTLEDLFEIRDWYILDTLLPPITNLQQGNNTSGPLTIQKQSSKKEIVTLRISSYAWRQLGGQKLKFFIWVKDHALHQSNTIETPLLTIE
ncbi:MAG: hypothetical protein WDO15_21325 [Bacteroidota bacterium]